MVFRAEKLFNLLNEWSFAGEGGAGDDECLMEMFSMAGCI